MLYKIDKKSKENFINLIYTFVPKDNITSPEEEKLLENIEKILFNGEKLPTKTKYEKEEDIKKVFSTIPVELKEYLKKILLEINDKNKYSEDGIISKLPFTKSMKGDLKKFIESLN